MAKAVTGGMADGLVLGGGYIMRWAAEDPATGATVTGVKVSNVNIDCEDVSAGGSADTGAVGPFMLVPGPSA